MSWAVRIPRALMQGIRADLARPHAFAAERVGFLFTKLGNRGVGIELLLAVRYEPVPDEKYIDDPRVGARYRPAVQRRLLESALGDGLGVLHVHEHAHLGRPHFSSVDLECVRGMLPSLRAVRSDQGHGALLLSRDSANAMCWMPASSGFSSDGRVVVVGRPTEIFLARGHHD